MFSSLGRPALVPILMPGGIGRMVAELVAADASNAAPPIASLANSRLVSGFCDSGLVILLKLRANGYLDVGLCTAEVGKIAYNAGEPGPGGGIVQVVGVVVVSSTVSRSDCFEIL